MAAEDINRIVKMAWEDRTPFDAITTQFGTAENEAIQFKMWREVVFKIEKPSTSKKEDSLNNFNVRDKELVHETK